MLDIKFIRENIDEVKEGCRKKQAEVDLDKLLELDEKKRKLLKEIEDLKAQKNKLGRENIKEAKLLKEKIKKAEPALEEIEGYLYQAMRQIPNLPLAEVPEGKDERDNKVLREEGQKKEFDFKPRDYLDIAEKLDIIDVKRAAKVSGTRFAYLKGQAVFLEFALIKLAFDVLTKEGFAPVIPQVILKPKAMSGMGYLDHDTDEVYHLHKDNLYLVGTSEQSIGPMHMDEIFQEKDLPRRYVSFSTCFRREAGAYGKDTKGILRVHQFDKVEMFIFSTPEKSKEEHQYLLSLEEKLMKMLDLPYRIVHLCSGDISTSSASTYDVETWLPGQGMYRETHSTSNCTDFQSRRLNIRYRSQKSRQTEFVHTLNGTAFAIGRMIIAIIENYQKKDGTFTIPEVLKKYIDFNSFDG